MFKRFIIFQLIENTSFRLPIKSLKQAICPLTDEGAVASKEDPSLVATPRPKQDRGMDFGM